jgi:aminomethyltransferase
MNRTACYDWHVARGARVVDFAGWDMPIQYTSITEEHTAVRTKSGLFDIGHMGRLKFTGPDACKFLDFLLTNDVTKLAVGDIRYALVTNEAGGILDDVLVYRFENSYLLVVNASNREKIVGWIDKHQTDFDVEMVDQTLDQFMLAIQGPQAVEVLTPLVDTDISAMKYYTGLETTLMEIPVIVTRTGYTGEDGYEVILPTEHGQDLWSKLISLGVTPAGLGCRDTLRLESAMPLYGHELDETTDPYTAGLAFGVKLQAGDFLGKAALVAAKENTDRPKRVGLELSGKRIAREGAEIYRGEEKIGTVTSGTYSPTLEKPIAMGYVPQSAAEVGTELEVDIRGKRLPATVVKLPFYKRA